MHGRFVQADRGRIMKMRVAFIAHPPDVRYIRNFWERVGLRKVGQWMEQGYRNGAIKWNLQHRINAGICILGPLITDKCRICSGAETFIEEVYSMPFTTAEIVNEANYGEVRRWGIRLLNMAARRGARIAGLGASVKGQATGSGKYFVDKVDGMRIANGNNNTAQVSIESGIAAVQRMGGSLENLVIAAVGANGSVGKVCAEMAAEYASKLVLIGSKKEDSMKRLEERAGIVERVADSRYGRVPKIILATDLGAIAEADLTYTATNSYKQTITPKITKGGSVVVDIARPHDTGRGNGFSEAGVLVIDGGLQYYDGSGEISFESMGAPPKYFLACAAEPLILAMAGDFNRDLIETNIDDALLLREYSKRFGFKTDTETFRYHYSPITQEKMEAIMRNAK